MTRLELTPEVEQLRDIVRQFSRDRLSPLAERAEDDRAVPTDIVRALNEIGILSPLESADEQALDALAMTLIAEELGTGDPGVAYEVMAGAHAALALGQLATSTQVASVMELAPAGALPLGSLWFYEGFGRAPDEYLTGVVEQDDRRILRGRKIAVVRPGTADFAVLVGRSGGRTVAVLLGPDDMARCRLARDDRESGKLGLNAAHTGNVELDDVVVRGAAMLTAGPELAVDRLVASARLSTAAVAVGAGRAAVRYAAEYAGTRIAFGQPIGNYQGVSFPLAEADMDINGAALAIQDVAYSVAGAVDPVALAAQTSRAVAAATRAALSATATAINTLGGHGFLEDYPVERWYRAAGTLGCIDHDPLVYA
jgi:alkylation response protein AidB-like acyl-CoA dehydrogenase